MPKEKRYELGSPHQPRDDQAVHQGTVTLREALARPLQGTREDQVMLRRDLPVDLAGHARMEIKRDLTEIAKRKRGFVADMLASHRKEERKRR